MNAAYLRFNAASILENALYYKLLRLAEKIWCLKKSTEIIGKNAKIIMAEY